MILSEEIQSLRERTLLDLNSAHDYYHESKVAWGLFRKNTLNKRQVRIRNPVTNTVTTHAQIAVRSIKYIAENLAEVAFQRIISVFENFFFDDLSDSALAKMSTA